MTSSCFSPRHIIISLLDMQKGRPVPVPEDMLKKYVLEPRLDMEYASRKITAPGERSLREPITVKNFLHDDQFLFFTQAYHNRSFSANSAVIYAAPDVSARTTI